MIPYHLFIPCKVSLNSPFRFHITKPFNQVDQLTILNLLLLTDGCYWTFDWHQSNLNRFLFDCKFNLWSCFYSWRSLMESEVFNKYYFRSINFHLLISQYYLDYFKFIWNLFMMIRKHLIYLVLFISMHFCSFHSRYFKKFGFLTNELIGLMNSILTCFSSYLNMNLVFNFHLNESGKTSFHYFVHPKFWDFY